MRRQYEYECCLDKNLEGDSYHVSMYYLKFVRRLRVRIAGYLVENRTAFLSSVSVVYLRCTNFLSMTIRKGRGWNSYYSGYFSGTTEKTNEKLQCMRFPVEMHSDSETDASALCQAHRPL
jgi:hypothetical protein